jgi:circadian clock protein KaiC
MSTNHTNKKESGFCPTGSEGLDNILGGEGLPRNRMYLIEGDPGSGKTTLSLQFLLAGIKRGEVGLYVTLSETRQELEAVVSSHNWSLNDVHLLELSSIVAGDAFSGSTFFHPSEVELNQTTKAILDHVEKLDPRLVIFDSLSELRLLSETALRYRRQILTFKQYFARRNATVLLLDDRTLESEASHVRSLAHGVIQLKKTSPEFGVTRRQVHVEKIRGLKFREGDHDFMIQTGGIVFFPRLIAAEHRKELPKGYLQSGIAELDALLGGGLDWGTSNVVMGPAGCGKSTLSLHYAVNAAKAGIKSALFLFDEGMGPLMARSSSIGLDIKPHVKSGAMQLIRVDPAEISPGEMVHRIRHQVEEEEVRLVVIDSLNGYYQAMPGEKYLQLQIHELFSYLNQLGVVTITVLAQQGMLGPMQTPIDLSYVADTVVLIRFFEAAGEVRQAISILKKRSGRHERSIREFKIESNIGIRVGKPLHDFHGVLSGTPTFTGAAKKMLTRSGKSQ